MEGTIAFTTHQDKFSLNELLSDRAILYSRNLLERQSLVQRTLRAAAAGIELNSDLSVNEGLYRIMDDIVKTDASLALQRQ